VVESTNKRLNNKQMAMEKKGDDLLGFRILVKPEVISGECSVGSKSELNDFREVKPVSFSLEGSNTKALKPPPFVDKAIRPEPLDFGLWDDRMAEK
jgi:hypothetical protein